MQFKKMFFGERSVTKLAALFSTNDMAQQAAQELVDRAHLNPTQIRVLGPHDSPATRGASIGRAVEPEQQGIWHTMIRAHVTFGIIGLVAGVLLLGVMLLAGVQAVSSSPYFSLMAFAFFGMIFGLLIGGALTARPDHAPVLSMVHEGLDDGHWAVVAHPVNADQTHEAAAILERDGEKFIRSL